jgi:hypothetical protein
MVLAAAGPIVAVGTKKYMQNEGASGYVDENKGKQVSGVRHAPGVCKGQRVIWSVREAQNEGASGYVDENKG